MCEIRVAEEGLNGWDNFTIMKFKVFVANAKVYALKGGWAGQCLVDDIV